MNQSNLKCQTENQTLSNQMQHVLNMKYTQDDALHECFDRSEFLRWLMFFVYNRGKGVWRGGGRLQWFVKKKNTNCFELFVNY